MEEKWKKYNEKYQVSNFGRIKSLNYRRTGKEKVLHPTITHNGYLIVKIEGKTITINLSCRFNIYPNTGKSETYSN